MISYWLDVMLCGMVVLGRLIQTIVIAILLQYTFNKFLNINLFKSFWKLSDKLDKKIIKIFG
mgnify:FL=1|jgi:hypothetical protein